MAMGADYFVVCVHGGLWQVPPLEESPVYKEVTVRSWCTVSVQQLLDVGSLGTGASGQQSRK